MRQEATAILVKTVLSLAWSALWGVSGASFPPDSVRSLHHYIIPDGSADNVLPVRFNQYKEVSKGMRIHPQCIPERKSPTHE
eukprot:12910338-Heterocapsa_arctica.AAC.1